jgi:hypothetical protein
MTPFADILKTLPAIDNIDSLALYTADSDTPVELIENKPGKAGSVAVYHALLLEFGTLNAEAAQKGLELYAEHVADAEANPGKHPNIDRLFQIIEQQTALRIEIIAK